MSKITSLFGNFNSEEEREAFMQSQFQVITNLTKQLEEYKKKIRHLEDLLKTATAPIIASGQVNDVSNEEKIAKEQLRVLQLTSTERELTLEEVKKVEILTKLLISLSQNTKKVSPLANTDPAKLLKIVEE